MADGFFDDDDPFESIVKEFFSERPARTRSSRESAMHDEEQEINFVETKEAVYVIVELPGYSESDVLVDVKDRRLEIQAAKKNVEKVAPYLAPRLKAGLKMIRALPAGLGKKFDYTVRNGMLEVKFGKK